MLSLKSAFNFFLKPIEFGLLLSFVLFMIAFCIFVHHSVVYTAQYDDLILLSSPRAHFSLAAPINKGPSLNWIGIQFNIDNISVPKQLLNILRCPSDMLNYNSLIVI